MSPERITAADVKVGDRISRTKRGPFRLVAEVTRNPSSVWIGFPPTPEADRFSRERFGKPAGLSRIRPGLNVKLWREDPVEREVRLAEEQVEDEMTAAELRGITAPDY